MPYTVDEFGNITRAEIVMEPSSVVSRMNVGRVYEHYFGALSRRTQALMRNDLNNNLDVNKCKPEQVLKAFDTLLGVLKIIGTEQYDGYLAVKDNFEAVKSIVHESVTKEVMFLYRVSSKKRPYQIVQETRNSIYNPQITPVFMKVDGEIREMKNPTRIAPIYEILLSKTAEDFLAVSSAKVNHYGLPINAGSAGKDRLPQKMNAVRNLSETETRLYLAYGSRKLIAELKDRANSIPTHKAMYKNILDAPIPSNIDDVVNRNVNPYGEDSALLLINNIFNPAGISIDYVGDSK